MKQHTKIYFKHFGIAFNESGWHDPIKCEVCSRILVDIHHIESRGMGGSKMKDSIHNLMALCRNCHVKFGDKRGYKEYLIQTHQKRLKSILSD